MTKFIQTKALIKVDSQAEIKKNVFNSQQYWNVKQPIFCFVEKVIEMSL